MEYLLKAVPITAKTISYGANLKQGTAHFRVWAPNARQVALRLLGHGDFPMQRDAGGTFSLTTEAGAGDRYFYMVDGSQPAPDPVSRLLPEGVHGPTAIVDPEAFGWTDRSWRGLDLRDYIIYELHIGTFTPRGTFDGVVERLEYLKDLGVTVIELMPVAAFPGTRNWGYDGVSPYAVQASYGGPDGLKRMVDAAHGAGLAVILDVVYNHLGNEGNYLRLFGPYFTDRHKTPWGDAINYDGPGSDGVRRYFVENALYWIREYHLDGLRLDAVQTIADDSPRHILAEIQENLQRLARELGRRVCVIAETDENDPRLVRSPSDGGYGLDAVWSDDFHHALHTVLTGEREGYYQDFGSKEQIVRALNEGFVFQGEHFRFWGKPRGAKPEGVPLPAHVICLQNHDQIGNRARGERLSQLTSPGAEKLAAALLLLAPHTPLLFMGQEYGETAPFQFFTDYGDPALQKAVREGRRREFKDFDWKDVPDPQDPATFERSRLTWAAEAQHADMLAWYRSLLELRRQIVAPGERTCQAELREGNIVVQVPAAAPKLLILAEFPGSPALADPPGGWRQRLAAQGDGYRTRVYVR
ncbi:MAG TPA: malto-oligosyltrehalose trehalohydrolase [Terriglobales bacterium]|nr:malto-oligosyltrehalose trehalohydrolase [Terriglobales bacterium]